MKSSPDIRSLFASFRRLVGLAIAVSAAAWASGFFGTVVPIGGNAADIALDEGRGVLYIANYTANRVEVMNTSDRSISTSINVPFPGSIALSRDGRYLVVGSYVNFLPAGQSANTLTVFDLNSNLRRAVALAAPPLGVAFGADGLALVLTTTEFLLLDPASATTLPLGTIAAVAAKTLPVVTPSFPPNILTASLGVSGDGQFIYGITDTLSFGYSVQQQAVFTGSYVSSPTLGPRLVSVNDDGSLYLAGWVAFSARAGNFGYQFYNVSGTLNLGSHAIDSAAGVIYAQIPDSGPPAAPPTSSTQCFPNGICLTLTVPPPAGTAPPIRATPPNLMIVDADNLAVRQRLLIPENLGGRSILNAARDTLYSISDSGVTVFPVGALKQQPQVAASQEDLVFRGSFCDRRTLTQEVTIGDPSSAGTDFSLSVDPALQSSITISPTSGVTPATVKISIDPSAFQNAKGTSTAFVNINSSTAINLQPAASCPVPASYSSWAAGCIRLLINNREPDQRGTMVNVPGVLTDLLADSSRNRFYIIRQDKNQVLVFNGATNSKIATLRTSNNPMHMAITADSRYLLVGHNDAQIISVFDLDTLEESTPIRMPSGFYPRSLAVSGNSILVASRVAVSPDNQISRVDFESRTAIPFPSLGPFRNSISADTVLVAAPHGSYIMAAGADGGTFLYDAAAETFTVARKDYTALSGAYAASDFGQFAVDNNLLNQSLSRVALLDKGQGGTSGFAFMGQSIVRTTGPITSGALSAPGAGPVNTPGVIQRVALSNPSAAVSTRIVEAPLFPTASAAATSGTTTPATTAFIRTLAPLVNGSIISLTQSGFTVLPPNFDSTTAKPVVSSVVNTSDRNQPLTAGGMISVIGSNLGQTTVSTNANPAPTVLGDSCVTVNGSVAPLFLVSPVQINGQVPSSAGGSGQLVVYTPGGSSDPFSFTAQPSAPSVFQIPSAPGASDSIPAIYREANNLPVTLTNPVHKGDHLNIFASGLGPTIPPVDPGAQSPNPPALVVTKPDVTLDGATCPVTFAGLVPGRIGVYQINVNVPKGIQQGLFIPLTVSQGSSTSTVYVRVVE